MWADIGHLGDMLCTHRLPTNNKPSLSFDRYLWFKKMRGSFGFVLEWSDVTPEESYKNIAETSRNVNKIFSKLNYDFLAYIITILESQMTGSFKYESKNVSNI